MGQKINAGRHLKGFHMRVKPLLFRFAAISEFDGQRRGQHKSDRDRLPVKETSVIGLVSFKGMGKSMSKVKKGASSRSAMVNVGSFNDC